MNTVLLTGANGFLGSHLLKKLLKSYQVIITLRKHSDTARIDELLKTSNNLHTIFVDDISAKELETLFASYPIDVIIHCATNYGRKKSYFFEVFNDNVVFPMKLLEIGQGYQLKHFINTDSYFNKEHLSYNALPHYSKTKKLLLNYLKEFAKNVTVINMRLEHIYGKNDNSDKFIPFLLGNLSSNQALQLTHGHQKRDFVYISDVVDTYVKIISLLHSVDAPFIELEVGSGISVSIREFVETLQKYLNSSSTISFGAINYRDDEIMNSYANNSLSDFATRHGIEFRFHDIHEGIKAMIRHG